MHELIGNPDFTAEELGKILSDKLFSKIAGIGLNGGEPFLKKDLVDCVRVICEKIPTLKYFYIISNGYTTELILQKMKEIRKICDEHNVKIDLSISVDGVGEMQDFMRGKKGAWEHADATVRMLKETQLCDSINIICTITKHNVYNLHEVERWAEKNSLNVNYNIATINVRINNDSRFEDFTVFNDENARFAAQEFFYRKAIQLQLPKYYGLYLFVKTGIRYAPCPCRRNDWVTLTPDSQLGYCATHSKNLGSALENSAYDIFNGNLDYLKELTDAECEHCSHYLYRLNRAGTKLFYDELIRMNTF